MKRLFATSMLSLAIAGCAQSRSALTKGERGAASGRGHAGSLDLRQCESGHGRACAGSDGHQGPNESAVVGPCSGTGRGGFAWGKRSDRRGGAISATGGAQRSATADRATHPWLAPGSHRGGAGRAGRHGTTLRWSYGRHARAGKRTRNDRSRTGCDRCRRRAGRFESQRYPAAAGALADNAVSPSASQSSLPPMAAPAPLPPITPAAAPRSQAPGAGVIHYSAQIPTSCRRCRTSPT